MTRLLPAALAAALLFGLPACAPPADPPEFVTLAPGDIRYLPPGETLRAGYPVPPPARTAHFPQGLRIMKRQVSQAEYLRCVQAGGCKAAPGASAAAPGLPAVGINWNDAQDYAAWLSASTGLALRLPTYAEWAYASGLLAPGANGADAVSADDRAQQWLRMYEEDSLRPAIEDGTPQAFGAHGTNTNGLLDMQGNVWEWTQDCHVRRHLDMADGETPNCGIRVAAGRHIAYIPDFIREPKNGGCSVGPAPANVGLRLVMDIGQ
ncbi:Nitrite reductase accessory protein NirV [plant metagenome]|uniref:Nitrite reductase accessory protein NirV n=1 Tax=plant metagenome TaxID=1297885 RepID=A0A484P1C3_9ZZZZ